MKYLLKFFKILTIILSINSLYPQDFSELDPMKAEYLLVLLDKLKKGENIIFTKYGDGEHNCMIGEIGCNCDYDSYHSWLGESLKKALVSLSKKPNTYIGKWWFPHTYEYNKEVHKFCDNLTKKNSITVPWVWYHLFMNDDDFFNYDYMHQFVKFIVNSKKKKIIIGNYMNKRLKDFFKADIYIEFPTNSWSFEYNKWKNLVEKQVENDCIVLISAGLCSKVLIDDITNKFNLTFIDLGSSFDLLARKQKSRSWLHSYETELEYYKDFIPDSWK